MEKSRVIELLKLDVLDINCKQDAEALQSLKKNNDDFPWEEYGYYQNLVALIAATTKIQMPSPTLKNVVLTKLLNYKNVVQPIEKEEIVHEVDTEITKNDVNFHEEVLEVAPVNDVSVIDQSEVQGRNSTKVRKEPISFREPNYSNIHILFEEKQNQVIREKELKSRIIQAKKEIPEKQKELPKKEDEILEIKEAVAEKEIKIPDNHIKYAKKEDEVFENKKAVVEKEMQIPDNHTELPINKHDKENLVKHAIEDGIEIREENKPVNELVKEFDLSSTIDNDELYSFTPRKWYQKKVFVSSAAVGLIVVSIVSVVLLSSSSDTKGNPVNNFNNKTIVSNIKNNDQQNVQPNLTTAEDTKLTEVEKNTGQAVTQENKKPVLPAPPKIIEAPIAENVKDNNISKTEKVEETVKEEVPVIPPKEEKKLEEESPYFVAVEEMPAPVGGIASIQSKITYPEIAKRSGVEGKVYILAYVDEVGIVTKAEVVKGIGSGCDEAARDAVLKTKFKPGVQRGNPVKVKVTIPIVFKK